jgi:hypothetical protein
VSHLRVVAPADRWATVAELPATGLALQLVINPCAIVPAGLLTLVVGQAWWWNVARWARRPAAG